MRASAAGFLPVWPVGDAAEDVFDVARRTHGAQRIN